MMRRKGMKCIVTERQIKCDMKGEVAAHLCRLPAPTFAPGLAETAQHNKYIQKGKKEEKKPFTVFSDHNGSLLRRQPKAIHSETT